MSVSFDDSTFDLEYWTTDLWDWVLELVEDPFYARAMHWDAERHYRHNGHEFERFINEPWTANAWWKAQVSEPSRAILTLMTNCPY